jgi:hypothetical protein
MSSQDRDTFGDGHGWRPFPTTLKLPGEPVWNYDVTKLVQFRNGIDFLGLYMIESKPIPMILFRARRRTQGLSFLTRHGSEHPHYVQDPIAWMRIPAS